MLQEHGRRGAFKGNISLISHYKSLSEQQVLGKPKCICILMSEYANFTKFNTERDIKISRSDPVIPKAFLTCLLPFSPNGQVILTYFLIKSHKLEL